MKRKNALFAGVLTACLCCDSLSVCAYTPDDVAQKAREAGWPETLIQTGYNEWASDNYTQKDLDDAYNSVLEYNDQSQEFICNAMGVDVNKVREKANASQPAEETSPEAQTEPPAETAPAPDSDTAAETTIDTTEPQTQTSDRIASSDFISMTLQEKTDYINTLEEDDKAEFIAGLTREERNSIIKQLPTEDKIALMKNYVDTAKDMGMNVVVDNISENDISVTVRDDSGVVIDKAAVGIIIDETGISHTKPLLFAGFGILTALAGFGLLYRYSSGTEKE